jgi:hypothetical protein
VIFEALDTVLVKTHKILWRFCERRAVDVNRIYFVSPVVVKGTEQ